MQATLEKLISYTIYQNPKRTELLKYLSDILSADTTEKSKRFIYTASKKSKKNLQNADSSSNFPIIFVVLSQMSPKKTFLKADFLKLKQSAGPPLKSLKFLKYKKNFRHSISNIHQPCFSTEQAAAAKRCLPDTSRKKHICPTTISASAA